MKDWRDTGYQGGRNGDIQEMMDENLIGFYCSLFGGCYGRIE